MRRALPAALVLVLGTVLAASSAGADHVPAPRTEAVYFRCSSATTSKVGNLDSAPAGWTTAAPTQSVQQGAGCGQANTPGFTFTSGSSVRVSTARFAGTFTGVLRDLNVRLDNIYVGGNRIGNDTPIAVRLRIDGQTVVDGTRVSVTPVPSSTRASEAYQFSVTGLGLLGHADDRTHTVELEVDGFSQTVNAWVYDTTEVPGGITFNPAALHPAKVARG